MDINSILLNQIGIVLNFFAGFLLAPELLGQRRLKAFEMHLEKLLHKSHNHINTSIHNTRDIWSQRTKIFLALALLILQYVLLADLHGYNSYMILMLGFIGIELGQLQKIRTHIRKQKMAPNKIRFASHLKLYPYFFSIRKPLLSVLVVPVICLTNAICTILSFLLLVLLVSAFPFIFILQKIMTYLMRAFTDENALSPKLIALGILFFITGNVLQFISTFLP